jgi:phospholipid N-methyltransferase
MANLQEHLKFLSQFLKSGRGISSPCPSSRALATAMCKYVDPNTPQIIVELGAGTGAITQVIIEKMHPNSTLLCVELNKELGVFLKQYSHKAHILIGDVKNTEDAFQKLKLEKFDVLISSLPFRSLPKQSLDAVLHFFCNYSKTADTPFCQLTIIPWLYKKVYKRIFKQVDSKLIWKSFPVGEVYSCKYVK